MSTLTKTLIVLLTCASIFMCAVVVTYVATADNYRLQYNELKSQTDAMKEGKRTLQKQLEDKSEQFLQTEQKLNTQIASLKAEMSEAKTNLNNAEREKATLLQKVNNWTSIVEGFTQTNDKQGQLLKNTLDELNEIKTGQLRQQRELEEKTAALIEKMAIIETLENENRRLVEEKTQLQSRLDRTYSQAGTMPQPVAPVSPQPGKAQPAEAVTAVAGIKGLVTEVDMKNSVAGISVGKADGVTQGMRFHVTRGDEFICDILVIDVEVGQAVGVLELLQQQPKVGDTISTVL